MKPIAEAELSFRISKDIAPRSSQKFSREDIVASVESVIPSIEIADSRFTSDSPSGFSVIADNSNGGVLVLSSEEVKDFHNVDLLGMKVKLIVNGQIHDTGVGANVLGNPWDSLTWLVNTLSSRNITLRR